MIFDFDTNYGHDYYYALRAVEFMDINREVIPLSLSDFDAVATSQYSSSRSPEKIFDTSLAKTGTANYTAWMSNGEGPQRVTITFNTPIDIKFFRIENYYYGSEDDRGVKNCKIYFSQVDLADMEYPTDYSYMEYDSILVFDGCFLQHSTTTGEEPEDITLIEYDTTTAKSVVFDIESCSTTNLSIGNLFFLNPDGSFIDLSTLDYEVLVSHPGTDISYLTDMDRATSWTSSSDYRQRIVINFDVALTFAAIALFKSSVESVSIKLSMTNTTSTSYQGSVSSVYYLYQNSFFESSVEKNNYNIAPCLKPTTINASRIVIDILDRADGWLEHSKCVREIAFFYQGEELYITQYNATALSTNHEHFDYAAIYAFDVQTMTTGDAREREYHSNDDEAGVRIILIPDEMMQFDEIRIINSLNISSSSQPQGFGNIKIYGTLEEVDNTAYQSELDSLFLISNLRLEPRPSGAYNRSHIPISTPLLPSNNIIPVSTFKITPQQVETYIGDEVKTYCDAPAVISIRGIGSAMISYMGTHSINILPFGGYAEYPDFLAAFIPTKHIALKSNQTSKVWNLPENNHHLKKWFQLILTGTENGTDNIILPMQSFSAQMSAGDKSFFSAVIPGIELFNEILYRLAGSLIVRMYIGDNYSELFTVAFRDVQKHKGHNSKSLIVTGDKQDNLIVGKNVNLEGVTYIKVDAQGKRHVRCSVNLFLQVGDIAFFDDTSMNVNNITYTIDTSSQRMEIKE